MILAVGTTTLRGSIEKFGLGLLEVQATPAMPRPSVLARYRETRPELAISLRLSADGTVPLLAHPDFPRALEGARAAQAVAVVLATGPRFAPTEPRRRELAEAAAALRDVARFVAWEPHGVWQTEEAERWAEGAEVLLVRDLTQADPPPGAIRYTRVRQLGMQSRITQGAVERLADALADSEEAYVIVEGDGARTLQSRLLPLLTGDLD